jgi:serine/threonine protein kinase/tetratricopeptide (TPR) repeat protein
MAIMDPDSQRDQSIFEAALDFTDPAERRAFLEQKCGEDGALRERIEKLLALSQKADPFFSECADALGAAAAESHASQANLTARSNLNAEPQENDRIGPYKLLQRIGEGGCGVVYMADQERPVRRRVALKIIKPGMDTKSVIARFEAERQALALMDHPNIARVLDAGATDTGRPYFVMELVCGVKITDFCDQNCLGMRERLELFARVGNAVQHAHQKGIIHRDLKPSNIMVTLHDGIPVPKVIDFGIAKATEQKLTDKTLFTSYAQLMGTPAYMSPEQMEMSGLNLDTRTDIYSLGVLLYELLTGRTPFDTAQLLKSGVDELRRAVRGQEPLSPSAKLKTLGNEEFTRTARMRQVEPPRLLSQLHGDLDWIVIKCLEKDRTRRYETVNGLAMDIQRHLKQEPVLACPPSRWYRVQKFVRRNRLACFSGGAVVTAVLAGAVISTLLFFKERDAERSEARLRKEAELREKESRVALLVTQRRFEEADKLIADVPLDKPSIEAAAELRALGDWHALHGRWQQAAERFGLTVRVNRLDGADLVCSDQLKFAASLVKSGDQRGYEHFRQSAVTKTQPKDLATEYWTFKAALVLPADTNLLQSLSQPADSVKDRFPTANLMRPSPAHGPQWSEALALLELRRAQFPEALKWCYCWESYPVHNGAGITTVALIKAMSNWQLGQYQTAVLNWSEAYELIQAKSLQGLDLGSKPSALFPAAIQPEELESFWFDWVIAGLLMRECDDLFAQRDHALFLGSKPKAVADDPAVVRAMGEWHAMRGEWEPARRCFEDLRQYHQSYQEGLSLDFLDDAIALLKLGDQSGFLRLRETVVRELEGANNEAVSRNVMKMALLLPTDDASASELQPFTEVLGRAVASAGPIKEGTTTPAGWNLMLLGLFDYRRGNYAKAIEWCRQSLNTSTYIAMPTVTDRAILAMSFHKLGDDSAARLEFERATGLVEGGMNFGLDIGTGATGSLLASSFKRQKL